MGEITRLLKNTQVYFIGNVLNRLGAFLLLPLYTHYLTTDQYGILELVLVSVALVRAFLGLNLSHATLRFHFEYKTKEDRDKLTSTMILFTSLWCLIFLVLFFYLSKPFSIWFTGTDRHTYLFLLAFILLCFEVASEIPLAALRANERSVVFVTTSGMNLMLRVGINIYLVAYLQKGVEGILIGNILATILIWGFLLVLTMKEIPLRYDHQKMVTLMKYSLPLALASIPGLLIKSADRIFLGRYASLTALGLYALAIRFGMILEGFVLEPFYLGFGPFRFSIMNRDDAPRTLATLMTYFVLLLTFFGLTIILFAPEVIFLISTKSFHEAHKIVPLFILATAIQGTHYLFQSGILIAKKTEVIPPISVAAALVNLAALYFLIPPFGALGAALAILLANLLNTVLTYQFSQRYYPIPYEWERLKKIIGTAMLVYVISLLSLGLGFWGGILIKSLTLLIFPVLLLLMKVLTQEEIEKIVFFKKEIGAFLINQGTKAHRHKESGALPMKVVIVTNVFPNPSEPTRGIFATHLVRALRKEFEVSAIIVPLPWCPKWAWIQHRFPRLYRNACIPNTWAWEGIPVFCPKYFLIPKIMGALQAISVFFAIFPFLFRLKREKRGQLLNARFIYPDGVATYGAARLLRLPTVLSALGTDINLYAHYRFRRPQIIAALLGSDQITAVSRGLKTEIINLGIPAKKISVIETGINAASFAPRDPALCRRQLNLDPHRAHLLFVGRLSEEKNIGLLIDAVRILQEEKWNRFDIHLIGSGDMQGEWEAQTRLLKDPSWIHFHGAIDHTEIPIWMGACSVFCLPSLREGTPNVILEAFASGRPVVASHVGGCVDLIQEDKNGYLCPPDDPRKWANALKAALSQTWSVDEIVSTVAHRTWQHTAEGYGEVLRRALGGQALLDFVQVSFHREEWGYEDALHEIKQSYIFQPVTKEYIRNVHGMLKSETSVTHTLLKALANEREHGEAKLEKRIVT